MKVAIYSRGSDEGMEQHFNTLMQELQHQKVNCVIYEPFLASPFMKNISSFSYTTFNRAEELDNTVDCLISLGGDGTLLDTITFIKNKFWRLKVLGGKHEKPFIR